MQGGPETQARECPDQAEGLAIVGDFPWLGSGLGSFATIQAYYKTQEPPAGFAAGSLLRWGAEAGLAGLALLALGLAIAAFLALLVGRTDKP